MAGVALFHGTIISSGVLIGVSEVYSKILRVRLRPDQYDAMALRASADGHTSISNWARAHLVGALGRSSAIVVGVSPEPLSIEASTSVMEAVESTPTPTPDRDVELQALLDQEFQ